MDLQGAPNLPQNINGVSDDHEHHLNIRLFKWAVEVSMRKPDDDKWIRADGVILFRAFIVGATTTEVIAVPYSIADVQGLHLLIVLHEAMKRLHILGSLENLPWIAYDLLLRELCLKFGLSSQFLVRYSNDFLVMFFDLKINQSCMENCNSESMEASIKQLCSNRMPHISNLEINAEVNLEKAEEIEECLKACPGMVVEKARGMEEVKSSVEIGVLTGSEEDDAPTCPICLIRMKVGNRHAITCCRHKFHKVCMAKWLIKRKPSCPYCPVCKNSLYFSK